MKPTLLKMKACLIFVLSILLFSVPNLVSATHSVSTELSYTHISGSDYVVDLKFYRDCTGIPAPVTGVVDISSISCITSTVVNLPLLSVTDVSTLCDPNLSNCNMGLWQGFELHHYSDTVNLPPCADYLLSWSHCCRNAAITNLVTPTSLSFYVETKMDNLNAPNNSSPRFNIDPIFVLFTNQNHVYSVGVTDPEGDSIVYSLTTPFDNVTTPVPYLPPFTFTNPITASSPLTIDQNGVMRVTPTATEVDAYAVLVEEYVGGVLATSMIRDMQVQVTFNSNVLPNITGLNGGTSFSDSICINDTASYFVTAMDSNTTDTLSILPATNLSLGYNPFSTVIGSAPGAITSNFSWVPTSTGWHHFIVKVEDDACPYIGIQAYTFSFYVYNCSVNDSVWPGDANSDGIANNIDLLNVALAFGTQGPSRASVSNNWEAYYCADWASSWGGSVNYKHTDCNGNGVINNSDNVAITFNYLMTHPKNTSSGTDDPNVPNAQILFDKDTYAQGQTITGKLYLGDVAQPLNSVYALACNVLVNPSDLEIQNQVDFNNNWLGSASQIIHLDTNFSTTGQLDLAVGRINQTSINGHGAVAEITFAIPNSVSTLDKNVTVNLVNIKLIDELGNEIQVDALSTELTITAKSTSIEDVEVNILNVYPNPSNSLITLTANGQINNIQMFNATGKVLNPEVSNNVIDVSNYNSGVYFIEATINNKTVHKKLIISE